MNLKDDRSVLSNLPHEVEKFANVGVWHYYTTTNKVIWSQGLHAIYEVTEQHFNGTFEDYITFLHPDDVEPVQNVIDHALKNNKSFSFDKRIITPGGKNKYIRNWGIVIRDKENEATQVTFLSMDITEIMNAELALKESETLNKKLVDHTPNAILIQSMDSEILFANETAAKLIKAPSVEYLIGRNSAEFRHELREGDLEKRLKRLRKSDQEVTKIELGFRCVDGSVKIGESITVPFEYEGKKTMLSIVNDITEQKEALKAVANSEARLRHFIENTPVAVAMFDLEMNYMACSENYIKDWWVSDENISTTSILGKNHYIIFTDVKDDWKIIHQRVMGGETLSEENDFFIKANGKKEWLRWKAQPWFKPSGSVGGIVLFTEFITQRKETERQLVETKNRNAALLNALPDTMFITATDGTFLDSQGSDSSVLALTSKEYLGKNIKDYLTTEDASLFIKKSKLAEKKGSTEVMEYTLEANGHTKYYEARIVKYDAGKVLSVVRDVTPGKEAEAHLVELANELTNSNAELKQYAYITSHDLRSPVVNLDSLLKLYESDMMSNDDRQEIFGKIVKSVDQLKSTLNDLIQLVSIKDDSKSLMVEISFEEVIDAALNGLETQINDVGASIYKNFDAPYVTSRRATVYSIVQNLVSNALKYSSDAKPVIKINTWSGEEHILLSVEDNGMGIDLKKYKGQLFGMYKRFHQNKEGKGLGLYIIKSQIEALGGFIDVKSEVGKGSTFVVGFKKT